MGATTIMPSRDSARLARLPAPGPRLTLQRDGCAQGGYKLPSLPALRSISAPPNPAPPPAPPPSLQLDLSDLVSRVCSPKSPPNCVLTCWVALDHGAQSLSLPGVTRRWFGTLLVQMV